MTLLSIPFPSGKNHVLNRTRRPACPFHIPFFSASVSALAAALLYPLLASGYSSLDTVSQDHKKLFATEPKHPQGGEYSWNGYELSSSQYGTQSNKRVRHTKKATATSASIPTSKPSPSKCNSNKTASAPA